MIFCFERGAFFAGYLKYKIVEREGKFLFSGRGMNAFSRMKSFEFEIPADEIINLQNALSPIRKWKKKYKNETGILDGYSWSVVFDYDGFRVESGGYEMFPPNYWVVVNNLQEYIELICSIYDNEYESEGRELRLKL